MPGKQVNKPPSLAKIGAAIGVVRSRVHALKGQGMPVDTIERAAAWYRANVRSASRVPAAGQELAKPTQAQPAPPASTPAPAAPAAAPVAAPLPPSDYQVARARREQADALQAELRVGLMADKLVERERVEKGVADAFRTLRDATFAACRGQAALVVGLNDVREVQGILEDGLRQAFADAEVLLRERLGSKEPA